jgi:hypothetical protein
MDIYKVDNKTLWVYENCRFKIDEHTQKILGNICNAYQNEPSI